MQLAKRQDVGQQCNASPDNPLFDLQQTSKKQHYNIEHKKYMSQLQDIEKWYREMKGNTMNPKKSKLDVGQPCELPQRSFIISMKLVSLYVQVNSEEEST